MRLPDDAWVRTTPESREQARKDAAWPIATELTALILEVLSVMAAERKIRKPIEIPRPDWLRPSTGEGITRAVNILKANARPGGGAVRYRPPAQGAT